MRKRKVYSDEFKVKVVLELLQRDTTIEKVKKKYAVSASLMQKWKRVFLNNSAKIFTISKKKKTQVPGESMPELKELIGKLTIENEILKKALERLD